MVRLDVFEIQSHVFSGCLILFELDPAVGPEVDFLGQPLVDGGKGLVHMGDAASGDFVVMLGNERGGGEGEGSLLLIGANPGAAEAGRPARGGQRSANGS